MYLVQYVKGKNKRNWLLIFKTPEDLSPLAPPTRMHLHFLFLLEKKERKKSEDLTTLIYIPIWQQSASMEDNFPFV